MCVHFLEAAVLTERVNTQSNKGLVQLHVPRSDQDGAGTFAWTAKETSLEAAALNSWFAQETQGSQGDKHDG